MCSSDLVFHDGSVFKAMVKVGSGDGGCVGGGGEVIGGFS